MAPKKKDYWESKEFDDLMDKAFASKDFAKKLQYFKEAYLLAKREAPWADIAGKIREHLEVDEYSRTIVTDRINLNTLRYILVKHGLLAPEDSPEDNHWDSPRFDELMAYANETDNTREFVSRLKPVYKFAERNAPCGTITAGNTEPDFEMERVKIFPTVMNGREKGIRMSYPINLEELRCILKEHGFLAPEDSPE